MMAMAAHPYTTFKEHAVTTVTGRTSASPHGAKDVTNMDGRNYTELQLQLSLELGVQMLKRPFKGFDLLKAYNDLRRRHCRPKLRSCQLSRPKQTSIQRHSSLEKRQFFTPPLLYIHLHLHIIFAAKCIHCTFSTLKVLSTSRICQGRSV